MSRIAIVTGGTRGIGAAISKSLHNAGCRVAALYAKDDEAAARFSEETHIAIFKFDVSNYQHCQEGVKMIQRDLGGDIDILINNAGITRDSTMIKMSPENWTKVIQNNLSSCYNMSSCVLEGMRENKFGRIINISSVNAQSGQYGQTNYAASKAGMLGFSKSLALETAHFNITVNTVAAGYVNTDMVKDVPEKILDTITKKIPLRRLAEPFEIARCVEFLVDDSSGYITGSTLSINGGLRMD